MINKKNKEIDKGPYQTSNHLMELIGYTFCPFPKQLNVKEQLGLLILLTYLKLST